MRKFCNNLMVCRWTDCYKKSKTKIVSLMSTKHTGDFVATGKAHYSSKLKIFKPDVIVEYNQTMGGVDNLSRNLDPYSCQRKTLKWYRKLAELFIEISIYNSYVIWKELTTSHATHLSFRQMLVREIITAHHYGATKNQRGRKIHEHPFRLTDRHFIRKISQFPKKRKRKCVVCHAKGVRCESTYQCEDCGNIALCIEPCFEIYHTKEDLKCGLYEEGTEISSSSDDSVSLVESD